MALRVLLGVFIQQCIALLPGKRPYLRLWEGRALWCTGKHRTVRVEWVGKHALWSHVGTVVEGAITLPRVRSVIPREMGMGQWGETSPPIRYNGSSSLCESGRVFPPSLTRRESFHQPCSAYPKPSCSLYLLYLSSSSWCSRWVGFGDCSGEDTSLRLSGQSTLVNPTRGVM